MPPVIESGGVCDIVRMIVVDEVFYLFNVFLLILAIFFIVDLGFDIEKGSAPVSTALTPMSLVRIMLVTE